MLPRYLRLLADEIRYPYALESLRTDHPGTSFPAEPSPALYAEFGVYPVQATDLPPHNPAAQVVAEAPPAQVAGHWTQQWTVTAKTPEAIAAYAAERRAALHEARRAARTAAETAGFWFAGHPVDSDRDSILRISNAAVTAITATLTAAPFATVWKCGDDYEMALDAAGVMALQASLAAHGQACHNRSTALGALIDDAAADLDAVAAALHTGWPSPEAPL